MSPRASRLLLSLVAAMGLASCGGGSSTSTAITSNYTLGGTISGLTVSSVVLANGSTTVSVAANASSWVFPGSFTAGSSYTVTVKTQPTGELCAVTSGATGTDTGDVGNVTVVCGYGDWVWNAGSNTANASGVYGTQGAASTSNGPGARYSGSSWTDSTGNFWLFGGVGYDSAGSTGDLNDLWEYSPSAKAWTWIGGGNAANAVGVYGTLGTAAAGNVPGARYAASSWIDSTGNLWLFGGIGYDSTGASGNLNDLWRYSRTTRQWTWVAGSNVANAAGVYGTEGTAAAGNAPGARYSATSWIDSSGNLWLFGGVGYGGSGALGNLSDLWEYSPSASKWTWVKGGSGNNAAGVYGTEATAASGNLPGARYAASSWIDSSGNLWLFGGYGDDSTGTAGKLNDLWEYSPSSKEWTWVSGVLTANSAGFYDVLGTEAAGNVPGARQGASSWIDSSGNLWLFGGIGYDATGNVGNLNDLWEYSPSTDEWTWMSGGSGINARGLYGTKATAAVNDVPGARDSFSSWIDSAGELWLFGGNGYDSTGTLGYLNDLWEYNPSAGT
jgi:N-acetylneuraminic acid mutarotase